jgi:hypothetical protein
MTGLVFVSYAREDAGLILPLAHALLHHGADLWVDQLRISPGANWDRSVEDALYRCAKMLLFLSPAAVASEEVLAELRVAVADLRHLQGFLASVGQERKFSSLDTEDAFLSNLAAKLSPQVGRIAGWIEQELEGRREQP